MNKVHPSLIRIDADEVTYNMHIILRFELEQELIEDRIMVKDLPEAWNARMDEYLGIDVPDDARGVLQDMHWAGGGLGYFPTYSLGNVISVQIWERALEDLGDLDERFERGEFGELREWLTRAPLPDGEEVHAAGDDRARDGQPHRLGALRSLPAREAGSATGLTVARSLLRRSSG